MAKKEETALAKFEDENGILAVHGEKIQAVAIAVKEAAGAGGMSMSDLEKVAIPSGGALSWTVRTMNGEEPRTELFGAIVGDTENRSFWADEYDGSNSPPDCSSQDTITGISSSEDGPGGECGTCPHSQWGSAKKGSGQACNHRRVLLLLTPDSAMPVMVSIPPSSLKTVRRDFIVAAGQGYRPSEALWGFTLTTQKSGGGIPYSQVAVRFVRPLTAEELELTKEFNAAVSSIAIDSSVID